MISHLTDEFHQCFENLPDRIKRKAKENYKIWKRSPYHPRLEFKKVHTKRPIYSVRVGIGWRALGVIMDNAIVWFWIGSHSDYEKILRHL